MYFYQGLSSSDSEFVIQALSNYAKIFKVSICVVIHQPRYEVFEKFDHLILLSGGKCIYNGPAKETNEYFKKLGKYNSILLLHGLSVRF